MIERFCRFCRAPILWANEDGSLILCDRQQTLEGDLELTEDAGKLCARRTWRGGGLYREHVCLKAAVPIKRLAPSEQQRKDVEQALLLANKLSAQESRRGTRAFALRVLASEVRNLRAGARPEDDALDSLMAAYVAAVDELPASLVEKLEAVRVCRKRYYM